MWLLFFSFFFVFLSQWNRTQIDFAFVFLLFLSHSHPQMTTSWDSSWRITNFLTLETDNPSPSPVSSKKLYQPFGVLRIKHGCYAYTCFFYYAALDSVKLHRHSTRSQHRLSLGGTCFYWLNEGLFVQCSCPPWSCIPAFMESWRRNQACHEGNALWAFPIMFSLFCYPDFRVLFFPSCAQVVMLELLCNPRSSHQACFKAAVFLTNK